MSAVTYEVSERIARITLNRPGRGNGITRGLLSELERALSGRTRLRASTYCCCAGNGTGFCGGYDLVESRAEGTRDLRTRRSAARRHGTRWSTTR